MAVTAPLREELPRRRLRYRHHPVAPEQPVPIEELPTERRPPNLRRRLVVLDALCVASSWLLVLSIGVLSDRITGGIVGVAVGAAAMTLIALGLLAVLHMYRSRVNMLRSVTVERTALIAVVLTGVAWGVERARAVHPSVQVPVAGGILTFLALSTCRACFDAWVSLRRRDGSLSRPVVLIGSNTEIVEMTELLRGHPEIGYRPVGYLSDGLSNHPTLEDVPWIGPTARGSEAVRSVHATGAIIAANGIGSLELNRVVRELHAADLHVHLSSGLWNIGHRRLRQLPLAHEPFFYLEPPALRRAELALKRAVDVVGAALALVVASPIMGAAAVLIKLSDRGPVLFRQIRVGQHGERLVMHKFRTMTVDAESQIESLREHNDRNGPLFKMVDDPRVTRVGRWLRASSIDELPQLLDVLAGRLSLVGPRPALPEEVAHFDDELRERQRIRPGVTGLWQVEARHNSSFYAYRHLDLFYLENWSLGLDLAIIFATAGTLLSDVFSTLGRVHQRRRSTARRHPSTMPAAGTTGSGAPSILGSDHAAHDAAGEAETEAFAYGLRSASMSAVLVRETTASSSSDLSPSRERNS
jgi:exopolysaccharide biosynthesis polyprenyl glycosylphosphotransferase